MLSEQQELLYEWYLEDGWGRQLVANHMKTIWKRLYTRISKEDAAIDLVIHYGDPRKDYFG